MPFSSGKIEKHESKELDYLDNFFNINFIFFKINSAVYNLHKHQVTSKKQRQLFGH